MLLCLYSLSLVCLCRLCVVVLLCSGPSDVRGLCCLGPSKTYRRYCPLSGVEFHFHLLLEGVAQRDGVKQQHIGGRTATNIQAPREWKVDWLETLIRWFKGDKSVEVIDVHFNPMTQKVDGFPGEDEQAATAVQAAAAASVSSSFAASSSASSSASASSSSSASSWMAAPPAPKAKTNKKKSHHKKKTIPSVSVAVSLLSDAVCSPPSSPKQPSLSLLSPSCAPPSPSSSSSFAMLDMDLTSDMSPFGIDSVSASSSAASSSSELSEEQLAAAAAEEEEEHHEAWLRTFDSPVSLSPYPCDERAERGEKEDEFVRFCEQLEITFQRTQAAGDDDEHTVGEHDEMDLLDATRIDEDVLGSKLYNGTD